MYLAVAALPPEYPDTTFFTPLTCLNTASTPQKHPPANTAVASPGVAAFGGAPAKSGTAARAAPLHANVTMASNVVRRMGNLLGCAGCREPRNGVPRLVSAWFHPKPYDGRIARKF